MTNAVLCVYDEVIANTKQSTDLRKVINKHWNSKELITLIKQELGKVYE